MDVQVESDDLPISSVIRIPAPIGTEANTVIPHLSIFSHAI